MKRRAFLASAGALSGLAGCLRSRGSDAVDFDVGMSAADFRPEAVEVDVGGTVVWQNTSNRAHTVTAYEGEIPGDAAFFASGGYDSEATARRAYQDGLGGAIHSGERYEHTFEVPGEYDYFCIPHEPMGMVGTVRVTE